MSDDLRNAESAIGCELVEVSAVRPPEWLTVCDTPQQRQRRVGEIIQRQDKGRGEVSVAGHQDEEPAQQKPNWEAADIAEKDSCDRPIERRKAD